MILSRRFSPCAQTLSCKTDAPNLKPLTRDPKPQTRNSQVFVLAASDWDKYLEAWGSYPHAIFMKLPDSVDCSRHMGGDTAWSFNPGEGRGHGIGYSRHCIQVVAVLLGLEWLWMLDDNIQETREMDLEYLEASRRVP